MTLRSAAALACVAFSLVLGAASHAHAQTPRARPILVEYRFIPPFTSSQHTLRIDSAGNASMLDGSGRPPRMGVVSPADLARIRSALRAARAAGAPRAPRGPRQVTSKLLVIPGGPRYAWDDGWTVPRALTALCDLLLEVAPSTSTESAIS